MPKLRNVIIKYINENNGITRHRLNALVFYTEVKTIQKSGDQLTEALDSPFETIPYERSVSRIVEQLISTNTIEETETGALIANTTVETTPKQGYLIDIYTDETNTLSTERIIKNAKRTWVWKSFAYNDSEENLQSFADNYVNINKIKQRQHTT